MAWREDWAEQAATFTLRLRRATTAQWSLCTPEASGRGQEQARAHPLRPPAAMRAQASAHRVLRAGCPLLGTAAPNTGVMEAAQGDSECERPLGPGAALCGREGAGRGGEEAGAQGRGLHPLAGGVGYRGSPRGRCLPNAHLLYYEKSHVWQDSEEGPQGLGAGPGLPQTGLVLFRFPTCLL